MTEYTIEADRFDEFAAKFAQVGDGTGKIGKMIVKAMIKALDIVGDQIDVRTPVNIGALRGSRSSDMHGTPLHLTGVITTPLAYGIVVENGRAPGGKMPPVNAILYWVKRKGLAGTFSVKTRRRLGSQATRDKEDLAAAWAIARHIAKNGTKGAFMYRDGVEAARPYVEKLWDDLVDDLLTELSRP